LEAYNPKTCLKYRLIDSTIYKDQVNEILLSLSGTKQKEPKFVDLSKYEKVPITNQLKFSKNKIALIYAYGDVVLGSGDEGTVSSERISEAIRNARTDTSIKAIVLRVNSPGGSAIASEIIWRELKLATKTKPVVASFGDYAASGGYYIACAANKIVAEPTTITGSLGVFGLMLHGKELLNNKLGITTENIKTNRHSDFPSYTRPLDEAEKKFMQNEIDRIYNTFINHVAEGRKMKTDDVDKIAQGRVWSGIDAYNVKLVDTLGTISDAISLAAQLANINNYRVVHLPKLEEPFEKILKEIGSTKIKINIPPYTDVYYYLEKISKFYDIQARLPFEIKIY